MTDDIVTRLRRGAGLFPPYSVRNEAADEIERLRNLVTALVQQSCGTSDEHLFSNFIGVYAEAIREICTWGKYRMAYDTANRVCEAELITGEEASND